MEYTPNQWAMDNIHSRSDQYKVGRTTRQCGKTWAQGIEIDMGMTMEVGDGEPPTVGLLAPTYDKCLLVVRRYIDMINGAFGEGYYKVNMNEHRLWLPHNRASLVWLSADDPYGVVGYTLSKLCIDEAQNVSDLVYSKIHPTLAVRNAEVVVTGTPDVVVDQTWFEGLYRRGQDDLDEKVHSFTVSCYENPWITPETIIEAKKQLSERDFRMLYLGLPADEGERFFSNVSNALLPADIDLNFDPKIRYGMSADIAMHDDFTVVMIGEMATRKVVHMERWHKTGPLEAMDKIASIWDQWGNPTTIVDANGPGEFVPAELRARGMRVVPYKATMANKLPDHGRLAADIEHRRIMFPGWNILLSELEAMIPHRTPSGRLTIEAQAGFHDDCVSSLVMLNKLMHMRGHEATESYSYIGNNDHKYLKGY